MQNKRKPSALIIIIVYVRCSICIGLHNIEMHLCSKMMMVHNFVTLSDNNIQQKKILAKVWNRNSKSTTNNGKNIFIQQVKLNNRIFF